VHKIVYLPLARADILEAVDYIAGKLENPQAADRLLTELDKTIQRIAQLPYAHELYRTNRPIHDEVRKVPVRGYMLYYGVFDDTIEIRRFLHGRRDRNHIMDDL